jgi:hypothetical protein
MISSRRGNRAHRNAVATLLSRRQNRKMWLANFQVRHAPPITQCPGRGENDDWQTQNRYMQIEGFAELADKTADLKPLQITPKAA